MSSRNGDKSRFGRQRKQKLARRLEIRTLQAAKPAKPAGEPAPESGSESDEKPEGVLADAARLVGSALGTLAVESHLAPPPAHTQE